MAKKPVKKTETNTGKSKRKLSVQKIVVAVVVVVLLGFFIVNNFISNVVLLGFFIVNNFISNEPEVEYYTFTKEGELTFTDSLGALKAKVDLEIADTEYERQLGLMNRKEMKDNEGMLFIFPRQDYQSFWMRNTLISLDIMFVNDQKEIVTIHKNTKTLSDTSYPSSEPSIYVVEVIAGFTDRHNIQVGDKIDWMGTRIGL